MKNKFFLENYKWIKVGRNKFVVHDYLQKESFSFRDFSSTERMITIDGEFVVRLKGYMRDMLFITHNPILAEEIKMGVDDRLERHKSYK